MNDRIFKTAFFFSLFVFAILFLTLIITSALAMVGIDLGWFVIGPHNMDRAIITFALASIIIGTFFSRLIGKRPINAISSMSEASRRIASGDFDVHVREDIRIDEIRILAQNFNLMAKELSKTELLRSDFVENVSHEIKTPLANIEGYATLLQSKTLSEEKKADYISKILTNTKRLGELTGNILLLSRLDNSEGELSKVSYSLDEQIRETVLVFQDAWSNKEIELDIELEETLYCGNRELLSHVWQNIFGNAVKFTPKKGRISVYLKHCGTYVAVTVKDSGIGMSQDTVRRLYEKFYQGDKSRSGVGNGLGLPLAKRIVDLHGGTISVVSEEDVGSEFTVKLPLQP